MRTFSVLKAFLTALLLTTAATFVQGDESSPSKPIEVPDKISAAVIDGDSLYALTGKNELLRVDLKGRKAISVLMLPGRVEPPTLTVADGKACVGTRDEKGIWTLYVIDLAGGRITHTIKKDASPRGFAVDDRVVSVGGRDVRIFNAATGGIVATIKVGGGVLSDACRVGDHLYVAREYAGGLAIIDLKKSKLLDLIKTKDWLFQVRVGKDKAFVWGEFDGVGMIDLKTRVYAALDPPLANSEGQRLTIQTGPGGGLLILSAYAGIFKTDRIYQYNAAGKRIGETAVDKKLQLIGTWKDRAVFSSEKGIVLVSLTRAETKPNEDGHGRAPAVGSKSVP